MFVADLPLRHFYLILRALEYICSHHVLEPLIVHILFTKHEEHDTVNTDFERKAAEPYLFILLQGIEKGLEVVEGHLLLVHVVHCLVHDLFHDDSEGDTRAAGLFDALVGLGHHDQVWIGGTTVRGQCDKVNLVVAVSVGQNLSELPRVEFGFFVLQLIQTRHIYERDTLAVELDFFLVYVLGEALAELDA